MADPVQLSFQWVLDEVVKGVAHAGPREGRPGETQAEREVRERAVADARAYRRQVIRDLLDTIRQGTPPTDAHQVRMMQVLLTNALDADTIERDEDRAWLEAQVNGMASDLAKTHLAARDVVRRIRQRLFEEMTTLRESLSHAAEELADLEVRAGRMPPASLIVTPMIGIAIGVVAGAVVTKQLLYALALFGPVGGAIAALVAVVLSHFLRGAVEEHTAIACNATAAALYGHGVGALIKTVDHILDRYPGACDDERRDIVREAHAAYSTSRHALADIAARTAAECDGIDWRGLKLGRLIAETLESIGPLAAACEAICENPEDADSE